MASSIARVQRIRRAGVDIPADSGELILCKLTVKEIYSLSIEVT